VPPFLAVGISWYYKICLFGSFLTKNQIDMNELNLIITRQEELKTLINQCLDEHSKLLSKADEKKKAEEEKKGSKDEQPISRKELAAYLRISTVTVTDWMKKGLPYRRMHGRVFFMKSEVMAAMNSFNHKKNSFIGR